MRLAAPMPEPMHMLVQMMRAPERFASERAVAIWRAPCLYGKETSACQSAKPGATERKGRRKSKRTVQPSGCCTREGTQDLAVSKVDLERLQQADGSATYTESDGATVRVDLLGVEANVLDRHDRLGRESCRSRQTRRKAALAGALTFLSRASLASRKRKIGQPTLVELVQVNVVLRDTGALEDLGDGERGTDTHEVRLDADDGGHAELAEDREAEFLSLGAAGEEDGGGTVRDLCVAASTVHHIDRPSVQTRRDRTEVESCQVRMSNAPARRYRRGCCRSWRTPA
mgnify:CR=1 FL=1|jgi:hypothetical protein